MENPKLSNKLTEPGNEHQDTQPCEVTNAKFGHPSNDGFVKSQSGQKLLNFTQSNFPKDSQKQLRERKASQIEILNDLNYNPKASNLIKFMNVEQSLSNQADAKKNQETIVPVSYKKSVTH